MEAKAVFNQLSAENFAILRMLTILFAHSPSALATLDAMSPESQRDWLESKPLDDVFIAKALETFDLVRRGAHGPSSPAESGCES